MPARPTVVTVNTVSYGSHAEIPLIVRKPPAWLKDRLAPDRRSCTALTRYPLSRNDTELPLDGFVMTCTYWVPGSDRLIVVNPYAPLFQAPPSSPPYMYPPPSTPFNEGQIGFRYPLMKLLKLAWLLGNVPLTIGVSSISDFTDEPALAAIRPIVVAVSTVEFEPSYHHAPEDGSFHAASVTRGCATQYALGMSKAGVIPVLFSMLTPSCSGRSSPLLICTMFGCSE